MKFFNCLSYPFFKNILGFFSLQQTRIYCSFLGLSYVATPTLYLLPRPFKTYLNNKKEYHAHTKTQKKKPNDTIFYIRKKNMFNKTSSKSTKCFFMFSLKKLLLSCYYNSYLIILYIDMPEMEIFLFLFTTSGVYNLLLALYFCLFFHMYNSKKLIRHYVSFRIVIQKPSE